MQSGGLSLDGLDHLNTIGGDLIMAFNIRLVSLAGLRGVRTIGGSLILDTLHWTAARCETDAVTLGLTALTRVGGDVFLTHVLASELKGLQNLVDVGGSLVLLNMDGLTSIADLGSLRSVAENRSELFAAASYNRLPNGWYAQKKYDFITASNYSFMVSADSGTLHHLGLDNLLRVNGKPRATCGPGEYLQHGVVTLPGAPEQPPVTRAYVVPHPDGAVCLPCPLGTFQSRASHHQEMCQPVLECTRHGPGVRSTTRVEPTPSSNRECTVTWCPGGQFVPNAEGTDEVCVKCKSWETVRPARDGGGCAVALRMCTAACYQPDSKHNEIAQFQLAPVMRDNMMRTLASRPCESLAIDLDACTPLPQLGLMKQQIDANVEDLIGHAIVG